MWELPNALFASIVNNSLSSVWRYCLVLEPRFGTKRTMHVMFWLFLAHQTLSVLSASEPMASPLFIFHYGAAFVVDSALCVLLSSVRPARTFFLFMIYEDVWAFIFTLQMILSTNALTWNLLRLALSLGFLLLFERRLKKYYLRISENIETGYGLVIAISLFVYGALTATVFYVTYSVGSSSPFAFAEITAIALIMIFVLIVDVLLFVFLAGQNRKIELAHMDLQQKIFSSQIEAYEQIEQEARRHRHDERHHRLLVTELARKGDCQGIVDYLGQYEAQAEKGVEKEFCKNRTVNSIVSVYERKARQDGIALNADIALGKDTRIADIDFVVLLSNILENALHACRDARGREIVLSIARKGRKLTIFCENPCNKNLFLENDLPRAEGRDGIGVKSILHTAGKYDGDVDFSASSGLFQCAVLLNDP